MKLFSKSILLTDYNTASLTGVTDLDPLLDTDQGLFVQTTNLAPVFIISFSDPRIASAIWVKGDNLNDYTIAHSDDGSSWTDLTTVSGAGEYSYKEFARTADTYWRVSFSARQAGDPIYRLYSIHLVDKVLDLDNDTDRFNRLRAPRNRGTYYRTESGVLVWFEPFGYSLGKANITMEWSNLPNPSVANLQAALLGRIPFGRQCSVYPLPEWEPENFYQCVWENPFRFEQSTEVYDIGKKGTLIFREF